jgi:putative acetyltransferase
VAVATDDDYARVSLETGTMEAFAPARSMYEKAGFQPCPPFGDYTASACMTILLPTPDAGEAVKGVE